MTDLPSNELRFIFNTFSFLLWGALVMWMAAGFTMLEAGSVRTKNASVICLKNIGPYAVAGIAYYVIGYNLMYVDVGSVIGSFTLFRGPSSDELALLEGAEGAREAVIATDYAVMSDWFFQMVFVATAASIVSGALAERVKLWSFFVFTLVLTAFIYPVGKVTSRCAPPRGHPRPSIWKEAARSWMPPSTLRRSGNTAPHVNWSPLRRMCFSISDRRT